MIKCLIHTADWHLDPLKGHDRFQYEMDNFIASVENHIAEAKILPQEVRVCIVGDLFDNKEKEASNESVLLMARTLKRISDRFPTIVSIGNHDYDKNNLDRMDCLTPIMNIFSMFDHQQIRFCKKSECFVDENIVFCNYSVYEGNTRPPIEKFRKSHPDKIFAGLFHDMLIGSKNFVGDDVSTYSSHAQKTEIFDGCDFVMMGDIHKHQRIPFNVPLIYSGSLYQLGYGESVGGHGYVIWDLEENSFEFVELNSDYGLYNIEITNFDDIDNGTYKILNQ